MIHESVKIGEGTVVEETAVIEHNVRIGKNCYIGHFVQIRPGVIIGNDCKIKVHCFIAENGHFGNNVNIGEQSATTKYMIVEDDVFMGPGLMATNEKKMSHGGMHGVPLLSPSYIEKGVRIAASVSIGPGVRIMRNAMVKMKSLVITDILQNEIVQGVPAKRVGYVPQEERI